MALTLPESPPYFYLRVQLTNPQGATAEELFPMIVSRWLLTKNMNGLLVSAGVPYTTRK